MRVRRQQLAGCLQHLGPRRLAVGRRRRRGGGGGGGGGSSVPVRNLPASPSRTLSHSIGVGSPYCDGEVDHRLVDVGAAVDHRVAGRRSWRGSCRRRQARSRCRRPCGRAAGCRRRRRPGRRPGSEPSRSSIPLIESGVPLRAGRAVAGRRPGRPRPWSRRAATPPPLSRAQEELSRSDVRRPSAPPDRLAVADRDREEEVVAVAAAKRVGAAVVEQGVVAGPAARTSALSPGPVDEHVFAGFAAGQRVGAVAADQDRRRRLREAVGAEGVVAAQPGDHDRVERRRAGRSRSVARRRRAAAARSASKLARSRGRR